MLQPFHEQVHPVCCFITALPFTVYKFGCIQLIFLHNTGKEPAYLVKGTKYPLELDDVRRVYQGKWLNDQVTTF